MTALDRVKSSGTSSGTAPAAFAVAVIVLVALAAAAAAHFALDVIGDFALAHDSYDGMAHDSRTLAFVVVVVIATAGVLRLLWSALDSANESTGAFRALVEPVLELPIWRFAAMVAGGALIAVMAMESVDALVAGVRIDDVADSLGGSLPLGLIVTVTISVCFGIAVSRLFRALAAAHGTIVDLVCALLVGICQSHGSPRAIRTALSLESIGTSESVLSTRAAKRAPPPLVV